MRDEAVGERYAEALFALAREDGRVPETRSELERIVHLVAENPTLGRALRAPNVPDPIKKRILREVFSQGLSPLLINFLMVMVENRRLGALDAVAGRYRAMEQEAEGEITARVEAAVALPPDVQAAVAREVSTHTGRRAHLDWVEDPELLGGVVIRIQDHLIDYSLKKQLSDLRERMLGVRA